MPSSSFGVPTASTASGKASPMSFVKNRRKSKKKNRDVKKLVAFTAFLWHFFTGIERSLIVPTLYLMLEKNWNKSTAEKWYGYILSAYGTSVLITTPIYGYAASRGIRIKVLLFISKFFDISGNLIYFTCYSPFVCYVGRFVAGIGTGCEPLLYTDLTRCTTHKNRTPYVVTLAVGKELGLAAGPLVSLLFANVDFDQKGFSLNVYSAPGFFMAIIWAFHALILFQYPILDVNGLVADQEVSENESRWHKKFIEDSILNASIQKSKSFKELRENLTHYFTYPLVVLLIAIFSGSFDSMCLEAFLPAVASREYKWGVEKINYTYLGLFGVLVVSTIWAFLMTRLCGDRLLVVIFFGFMCLSYATLTVSMTMRDRLRQSYVEMLSLTGVALHGIAMPGVITVPDSLYSKLMPEEDIAFGQTIARMIGNIGFSLGMLFGGKLVAHPTFIAMAMLFIAALPVFLMLVRYKKFEAVHFASKKKLSMNVNTPATSEV